MLRPFEKVTEKPITFHRLWPSGVTGLWTRIWFCNWSWF